MLKSTVLKLLSVNYLHLFYLTIALLVIFSYNVNSAELSEIEARGNLIVGVKDNLRPLGYTDADGNLQGFEIDIAHRLAEELLGNPQAIKFVPLLNQNRLQAVVEDQVDLVIADVSLNSSRQRLVDFSDYYFLSATGIITKKSSQTINLRHSPHKIGVLQYSRAIDQLKYNLPQAELIPVISYQQALALMETEQIDGFAGDITVLTGWQQEYPDYQLLPHFWGGYPLAIVLPKGRQYQSLRDKINQIIKQLKQEGWLQERAKYWGLPTHSN
jgi:polar amino acid transport system substrate-binding protein